MITGQYHRGAAAALVAALCVFARTAPAAALELRSLAFVNGGEMPARLTCTDAGHSTPLEWSGAPAGTKSFALVVIDPDAPDPKAPKMTYVHWVVYDIPPAISSLS